MAPEVFWGSEARPSGWLSGRDHYKVFAELSRITFGIETLRLISSIGLNASLLSNLKDPPHIDDDLFHTLFKLHTLDGTTVWVLNEEQHEPIAGRTSPWDELVALDSKISGLVEKLGQQSHVVIVNITYISLRSPASLGAQFRAAVRGTGERIASIDRKIYPAANKILTYKALIAMLVGAAIWAWPPTAPGSSTESCPIVLTLGNESEIGERISPLAICGVQREWEDRLSHLSETEQTKAQQEALTLIAFDIGPAGIDGKRGPDTCGALNRYAKFRGYDQWEDDPKSLTKLLAWDAAFAILNRASLDDLERR